MRSGSVVECLTRDRGIAGLSLTGTTALCPCTRRIYPSLVLIHPKKTPPDIAENFFDWDVTNQIKQTNILGPARAFAVCVQQSVERDDDSKENMASGPTR